MPEEPKDREREGEEDFEPLDKFFAPIEDVDWPEEGAEPGRPGGTGGPTPPADGPIEDDLLPSDIPDDPLAGLDMEEVSAPTPARVEPTPTAAPGQSAGEPTQELSGEEWEELRLDVGESGRPQAPPATNDEALAWSDEPDADDAGPLSVEDMKNAPPEYAELPGPRDGGEAGGTELPVADEVGAEPDAQPGLRDVEAAADRFAESLRGDEPEPLVTPGAGASGPLSPAEEVEQDLLSDLDREPTPPPTVTVGVSGPSWQEPTSEEVTSAPSGPPLGGRNLPLALLSGLVLVGIGIGSIALGKAPFTVVAGAVIVLAQGELYAALHRRGYQPATALGLVFGGMISAAAYLRGESGALAMFSLGSIFTFLWFMATPAKARQNALVNVAMTILPLAYIALLGSYVMTILALDGGRTLVLCVIGLAVGYDIAAFGIGTLWGQRPLAPTISPRKSWEAAIGAPIILLIVAIAFLASLDPFKAAGGSAVFRAIGLALIVSVFAQLGDLAESMLKRDLGVKDMGSIIPGHGGILDRIDSILFAAPAAFYLIQLFFR